ncbi:efflux RND transporter permease subunit [Streptomyces sp. NPDC053513]|uniref:efflux RND transporter permease subunit n=1 Tax=unclassified Streptomyces TaxID=2593676 RepID=UPI0037CEB373
MTEERGTLMRWIVRSSLRFRYLVVAAAAVMMVVGITSLPQTRVDVFPEFAPPRVEIQTTCLGLSTADVESLVTVPLEQSLNGLDGLEDLRSESVAQLSSIQLIFHEGADLFKARQEVQERVQQVSPSLPTWAAPPVIMPPVAATSRVMKIGMSSDDHSDKALMSMSMTAYWEVRARLLRVPGVANVSIFGERLKMMTVQVDPLKMQAHKVSLDDVMEATGESVDSGLLKFTAGSVIGTGGWIETPRQRLGIRHVLPVVTPADLSKVPVHATGDRTVRLGDVALVKEDHQPLGGDAVVGSDPGLLLIVEKLPWGDTPEITKNVEKAIASLEPGLPGVHFDTTIFQQQDFIHTAIDNLTQALVLGFLLVVVVLAAFLYEWRVALISLLTIPLSLMAAVLVLHWRGDTVNTMALAGLVIALGAVVDDAIIDVENILRRLREHRKSGGDTSGDTSVAKIILNASLEVRSPIVYATMIIVVATVPVFLLQGVAGSFFRTLAFSYTLAILASMVVALTVTPALCLIMLRKARVERRQSPLLRRLQNGYTAGLRRIVKRPVNAYLVSGVLVLVAALLVPQLSQSLMPSFKERDFLMHFISTPGTSVQEEQRMVSQVSREVRAIPGVRNVFGAHIGQAFLGDEIAGVNFGEGWISIDPKADYDKTLTQVKETVGRYAGMEQNVQTYLNERVDEVLTGSKYPVVVRLFGQDQKLLREKGLELQEKIGKIAGTEDVHADLQVDVPQIQVKVDVDKAAKYELKPGDVRRAASTLVAGEEVGDIFRDGRAYDTVVWSTPETRDNVAAISRLPIDTPAGTPVRLGDVAQVVIEPQPNLIARENGSRHLDVNAGVSGRDLSAVVADVEKAIDSTEFPRGYHTELLGEHEERQAAQRVLFYSAVFAALAIFILLQVSFRSWRLALLSFLTLPMALVGGVLAVWIAGGNITLGSLVGFFTVLGIAARNGILLINHYQHLEEHEGMTFGPALVLRGARERLSPILMTSLATGLAVLPLVILGNRPGHEIEYPLAVVIVGGLVTSTLLNLLVVPSLYLRFGKGFRRHRPQHEAAATH